MNQLDIKLSQGLQVDVEFYHKTGYGRSINDDVRVVDYLKNQGFPCSFPWGC